MEMCQEELRQKENKTMAEVDRIMGRLTNIHCNGCGEPPKIVGKLYRYQGGIYLCRGCRILKGKIITGGYG